jgi:hypothetical protein
MLLTQLIGLLIAGTVTLTDATGAVMPATGVQLTLTCNTRTPLLSVSGETGAFRFADAPKGECTVTTDLQGFVPATAPISEHANDGATLAFHLQTVPVRSGVAAVGGVPNARTRKSCAKQKQRAGVRPQQAGLLLDAIC